VKTLLDGWSKPPFLPPEKSAGPWFSQAGAYDLIAFKFLDLLSLPFKP
jgi:hypothetical protein